MFKEVTQDVIQTFRLIYHQTTGYSNPIIEAVLYENKMGKMYFFGDLIEGNYLIFHRSGFSHINFNSFDNSINAAFFRELDAFIKNNTDIPDYLMFYYTPMNLLNYWRDQKKQYFKI